MFTQLSSYTKYIYACIYSGTYAIRHLSFPASCDIRQKLMVPKLSVGLDMFTVHVMALMTLRKTIIDII